MPPTTEPLLTFFGFYQWPPRDGVRVNLEVACQPPHQQVAETLLLQVWLHEELGSHQNGAGDAPLHLGLVSTHDLDQHVATTLGGWTRAIYIQMIGAG